MDFPVSFDIKTRCGVCYHFGLTDQCCCNPKQATRSPGIVSKPVGHSFTEAGDDLLRLPFGNASSTCEPIRATLFQRELAAPWIGLGRPGDCCCSALTTRKLEE